MQVVAHPGQEEVVQVLVGGWHLGQLALHWPDEFIRDLVDLVSGEQVAHLARWQHVVHELQEALFLDLVVRELERHAFALHTWCPVQLLQVFHQVLAVVRTRQDDLEGLVAGNERGQAGNRLFTWLLNRHSSFNTLKS